MGPLTLNGNGHGDEQGPKLKIKKISFTCDAFFAKKEANWSFWLDTEVQHCRRRAAHEENWEHKLFGSHHVGQMVESHREAVFSSQGLPVVSDHQLQVLLPHRSPEQDLGLKKTKTNTPQRYVYCV